MTHLDFWLPEGRVYIVSEKTAVLRGIRDQNRMKLGKIGLWP